MLIGTDFEANPLAGAPAAAVITGSGATLQPDAAATGTGSVALTAGTTLASLGINSGDTITINDGTNTPFTYTSTGTDTVGDLVAAIHAAKQVAPLTSMLRSTAAAISSSPVQTALLRSPLAAPPPETPR